MNPNYARRSIPSDYAEMRAKYSARRLCSHYGAGGTTIARWDREIGLVSNRPKMPAPPDFLESAPFMSKVEMRRKWAVSKTTLERWLADAGIRPQVRKTVFNSTWRAALPIVQRHTEYDLAADYLRKFGPVSKCHKSGEWSLSGEFYRVGAIVRTKDELLEMAARKKAREIRLSIAA